MTSAPTDRALAVAAATVIACLTVGGISAWLDHPFACALAVGASFGALALYLISSWIAPT